MMRLFGFLLLIWRGIVLTGDNEELSELGGIVWFGCCANLDISKNRRPRKCVSCKVELNVYNTSLDYSLCKNCFLVDMAEIEAEDREEDACSKIGRLQRFLG
jgi:hypothetical protein